MAVIDLERSPGLLSTVDLTDSIIDNIKFRIADRREWFSKDLD